MPYIAFDELMSGWPDDETNVPPKRLSDFEFLPAPVFTKATDIVRFDSDGKRISAAHQASECDCNARERAKLVPELHSRFALLLPCMRDVGLTKIYCRADGGHDDSFSWVSHGILENGNRVSADAVCDLLICSSKFTGDLKRRLSWENDKRSDVTVVRDTLDIDLCSLMWGPWLFGHSFGCGQFCFYGAYTVDLERGTIVEDPDADPVVRHIAILKN